MSQRSGDFRYLLRQWQTWYAVVEVPPSLRPKLGRRLKISLGTRDVTLARARKWRAVADLRDRIEAARRGTEGSTLTQEAQEYRSALANAIKHDAAYPPDIDWSDNEAVAAASETSQETLVLDAVRDRAEAIERDRGYRAAEAFHAVATGRATPLGTYVDQWLSEGTLRGSPLRPRTKLERRRAVEKLVAWLEQQSLVSTIEAVTRRIAGRYVSEALVPSGRDAVTLSKSVRSLSSYWAWLQRRGHLSDDARNPWSGQAPHKAAPDANGIDAERAFTDAEVARLLADPPEHMKDFLMVAALSGMGREEIGRLTVADCVGRVFIVREGKTAAAARRVPIHSGLGELVARRLKDKAPDAFLFDELRSGTTERTDPIGKAFTRYRRQLGIQEGSARRSLVNFHSFRRWFVTAAVNAKPEAAHIVSLVVGHKEGRKGMTLGRYWQGADDAALRAVVEAVRLPFAESQKRAHGPSRRRARRNSRSSAEWVAASGR